MAAMLVNCDFILLYSISVYYKVVQKFKNYQYRQSHAQIALCYAVASATWLP